MKSLKLGEVMDEPVSESVEASADDADEADTEEDEEEEEGGEIERAQDTGVERATEERYLISGRSMPFANI